VNDFITEEEYRPNLDSRINLVYQAHHQNQIVRSAIALNLRYSQGAGIEEKETLAQEQISFLSLFPTQNLLVKERTDLEKQPQKEKKQTLGQQWPKMRLPKKQQLRLHQWPGVWVTILPIHTLSQQLLQLIIE